MKDDLLKAVQAAVQRAAHPESSAASASSVVEADLLPHRGVVFLDDDGSGAQQWLTNTITHEHVRLPNSCKWSLDFTGDGFAMLLPDSPDHEALLGDEVLTMSVWRCQDGRLFIVSESGALKGQQVDVRSFQSKHYGAKIHLRLMPARTNIALQSWFLRWPRAPNCKAFVSAKSVYQVLGLDQFNSEWWRWAWAGLKRWPGRLKKYGLQQHILRSFHCEVDAHWAQIRFFSGVKRNFAASPPSRDALLQPSLPEWFLCSRLLSFVANGLANIDKASPDDDAVAMLPHTSFSAWALVVLLMRWAYSNPRQGGMSQESHKRACADLLDSLLQECVVGDKGVNIFVDLDDAWEIKHPRPQPLKRPVVLKVGPDAMVDTKSFFDGLLSSGGASAGGWWSSAELKKFKESMPESASLACFLSNTADARRLWPLHLQVLWRVGDLAQRAWCDGFWEKAGARTRVVKKSMDDCLIDPDGLDHHLVSYLLSSRNAASGERFFSCCTDKSSVAGLAGGLQSTIFVLPRANKALFAPPQVCKAYDPRLSDAKAASGDTGVEKEKAAQALQMRLWVKRKCDENGTPSWRPQKRYRTASRTWLQNLDNQIRYSLGLPGLVSFVPDEAKTGCWKDWRTMRHLLISVDQGGDNLCAVSFLKSIGANISVICDWSHGANNDYHDAMRDMGLFKFYLMSLILMNVEHGPWSEDLRWAQCVEAWNDLREHGSSKSCPLFLEYAGQIAEELSRCGALDAGPGEDIEAAAWRALEAEGPCRRKGTKTNLARFQAGRRAAAVLLERWASKRFVYEYVALQSNMLDARSTAQLVVRGTDPANDDDGGEQKQTTDSRRTTASEKILRTACQNALVISCLLLESDYNYRLLTVLVATSQPIDDWHKCQNCALRSTADSQKWMYDQHAGGFFLHVTVVCEKVKDATLLRSAGMALGSADPTDQEVAGDLDIASAMGEFCLRLASRRVMRCLWFLRGWPFGFIGVLGPDSQCQKSLAAFRDDLSAYQAMEDLPAKPAMVKRYLHRSPFQETTNKQFAQAVRELNYTASDELKQVTQQKLCGMCATQAAEDTFNHMKNHRIIKCSKKFRKPTKVMSAVLSRKVLSSIHKYAEVSVDSAPPMLTAALPKEAFQPKTSSSSLPFNRIVSTSSSVPWHSPGAMNWSLSTADMAMVKFANDTGRWDALEHAWLSTLIRPAHKLLLQFPGDPKWYFGLHSWADSAALLFPAVVGALPGGGPQFWQVDGNMREPLLKAIVSLEGVVGICYEWRAPSWQRQRSPAAKDLAPELRAFSVTGGAQPFVQLAAKQAFWALEKTTLGRLARQLQHTIRAGSSIFETVWQLVEACLPDESEEARLAIMRLRVGNFDHGSAFTDEFLQVEEAVQVLEHSDREQLQHEQKTCREQQVQAAEYKQQCRTKAKEMREAAAGKETGQKKKSRPKPASAATSYPAHVPPWPKASIELVEARKYVPSGASLWRDVKHGNWQGHAENGKYARISRSWQKYGEPRSLQLVLQNLWHWHLFDRGLEDKDCPIDNIFGAAWVEAAAVAASSSSSSAPGRRRA